MTKMTLSGGDEEKYGQHAFSARFMLLGKVVKGAGSRNVNKRLSKRLFCNIFDRPYHSDFPILFSK